MTQQFENFVNAALDKSLASDVTLPTANKIPVYTGIGRQVTGKTPTELGLASSADILTLGETETTAYRGDRGKAAYTHSQATGNPHGTAIADISGLTSALAGKEPALADVITANTYGSSTQYPKVTVNAKGIVTGVTLQTVPMPTFTDANFSVQKNGSPSIAASWSLTALTESREHTYPNKNINFGDLPSVATNDINSLSDTAVRGRILGGRGNTVSGTDNIVIGGSWNAVTGSRAIFINCNVAGTSANDVIALNARGPNTSGLEENSILLGTSKQTDLFKNIGTAAALRLNALYALSSDIPISGTLYATIDGSQTLSASNLVLGVNSTGGCATHEVEFIVCAGTASGFGGVLPTGYFIAKRRIAVFRHAPSGTFYVSAVQTIGTDVTLGTLGGTITPDLSIDTTTSSATIHRLLCKIDRTGGVAGQGVVAMSVRVTSHHSR